MAAINTYTVKLRDAEEIEEFYLRATGMKPDFLQLSAGAMDLQHRVDELGGVTLIWTRAQGRTRWCDDMNQGVLHMGFVIESAGPVVVRGRSIDTSYVQVWVPGKEMDYIMNGPLLTLEIGVDMHLVETLGWKPRGEPLRKTSEKSLSRLIWTCRRASSAVRGKTEYALTPHKVAETEQWRDLVLDAIEPVLQPWLSESETESVLPAYDTRHYRLVKHADDFFNSLGCDSSFEVSSLAESLGVPRRTLFHAYKKLLGIGPRRYLEIKRLHTLRFRLRHATSDATVTSIATELGFTNLGRLAALYRHQFGENPSETLRQS